MSSNWGGKGSTENNQQRYFIKSKVENDKLRW